MAQSNMDRASLEPFEAARDHLPGPAGCERARVDLSAATARHWLASGDELSNYLTEHIGEAKIAALEAVGQLGVVKAEQVEQRGVEVVNVHFVLGGVESKLVRFAEG